MVKKKLYVFLIALLTICCSRSFSDFLSVCNSIADMRNPTEEDYQKIQDYLTFGDRKLLFLLMFSNNPYEMYFRYDLRMRNFRILPTNPSQSISDNLYIYNTDENDLDRCIICYISFNGRYEEGIGRIDKCLQKIGYKGHFIAKIGGWPNLEGGDLCLADVPYAFKPCFFEEVKNLGYKNVLWLDSSIIVLQNIDSVFEKIEKTGYFGYLASHKVVDYTTDYVLKIFGMQRNLAENILTVETGILGLNLKSDIGQTILTDWRKAASNGAFYSSRPDQNALSIISYLIGLQEWDAPVSRANQLQDINDSSIFCVDHSFFNIP